MDKQLKTELRKLLTGRTIRDEEGWLIAIPEGNYLLYHGVSDKTGYRAIISRTGRIQAASSNEEAFSLVFNALQEIGMLVNMYTLPDALCALCRVPITKSLVICVLPGENGMVHVRVYTGRSLGAGICCRIVIAKFAKKLKQRQANETKD